MTSARTRIALVIMAALTLPLTAPSAASASGKTENTFKLKGSHGYTIQGFGQRPGVAMTAKKGGAFSTYIVKGRTTAKLIKGDLGRFGAINVRFHVRKTKHLPPRKGCTGPNRTERVGVWTGKIAFRGEHGYTKVRAKQAKGVVLFPRKHHCEGPTPPPTTGLRAIRFAKSSFLYFTATEAKGFPHSSFTATEVQNLNGLKPPASPGPGSPPPSKGVLIVRGAAVDGPLSAFTFDSGLTQATVDPPSPFSGEGDFTSPSSWTGSLAVSFPGQKDVRLVGKGFDARLVSGP
jgi:hypothetical protein